MGDMTEEVKTTMRQMLQSTQFLGIYRERRYIEQLQAYRDVVVVAESEQNFRRSLSQVWTRLTHHFGAAAVLGITPPPDLCLHVNLRHGVTLGPHWFRVRELLFSDTGEVALKLKHVRNVDTADIAAATAPSAPSAEDSSVNDISWAEVGERLQSMLTVHNALQLTRFTLLLLLTLATGLYSAMQAFSAFSLRFMQEVSRLVQAATPLLLGLSDFLSKILGAILILLSMVWKDVFYLARRRLDPEGTPPEPPSHSGFPGLAPSRPALTYNTPSNTFYPPRRFPGSVYPPNLSGQAQPFVTRRQRQVQITELQ